MNGEDLKFHIDDDRHNEKDRCDNQSNSFDCFPIQNIPNSTSQN